MAATTRRHTKAVTPKQAAAITFEAMTLEPMLSGDEFLALCRQQQLVLRAAHKLLRHNPKDMAAAIVESYGEDAAGEILIDLDASIDWLKGWQDILAAAQARATIALSQRFTGMHDA